MVHMKLQESQQERDNNGITKWRKSPGTSETEKMLYYLLEEESTASK